MRMTALYNSFNPMINEITEESESKAERACKRILFELESKLDKITSILTIKGAHKKLNEDVNSMIVDFLRGSKK
jgi:hypothetical protein